MSNFKNIIWDWNGTLLNDIDLCINSMNQLLKRRGLKTISKEYYKDIFTFPVIEYYKELGFNFEKESFKIPAHEFIEVYKSNFNSCSLHTDAIEIIKFFNFKGVNQFILSAMEQEELGRTVKMP